MEPSQEDKSRNKLYIAGCGRSGTTLLLRLMYTFEDVQVVRKESPFERFATEEGDQKVLIIKRDGGAFKQLPSLPEDVHLLYAVRHPFDVMTSFHPNSKHPDRYYISPQRWLNEYRALKALRTAQPKRKIVYIKYEDLVTQPDREQERFCREFPFLRVEKKFSDPANNIKVTSTDKWRKNQKFLDDMYALPAIAKAEMIPFFNEFGYNVPKGWVDNRDSSYTKRFLRRVMKRIEKMNLP